MSFPPVKLGRFLTHRSEFIEIADSRSYKRLRVQLHGRGIVLRDEIEGIQIKTKKQQVVRQGDFVVAEIDAKLGGLGLVPLELDGGIVSSHYFVFDVDESVCLRGWLEAVIRAGHLEEQVSAQGSTNYAAIRPAHVLEFEIPLPLLPEQRRIVERLEAIASRLAQIRQLRTQSIQESERFVVSLHLQLAGRGVSKLGEVLCLDERSEAVRAGHQYPQVGLKSFGAGLFEKAPVEAENTSYKTFNRLFAGAVVLSQVKGWEGAIAVCPKNLEGQFVSPEYRTFSCVSERAIPEYLASVVVLPWFWLRLQDATRGVGARRERTRPESFLTLEIPMPTVEQQEWALPILRRVGELARSQNRTVPLLAGLESSVLIATLGGAEEPKN